MVLDGSISKTKNGFHSIFIRLKQKTPGYPGVFCLTLGFVAKFKNWNQFALQL